MSQQAIDRAGRTPEVSRLAGAVPMFEVSLGWRQREEGEVGVCRVLQPEASVLELARQLVTRVAVAGVHDLVMGAPNPVEGWQSDQCNAPRPGHPVDLGEGGLVVVNG